MLDIYEPEEDADDARMRRAAGGDSGAFEEVVRGYQGRVGGFAVRMLGGDRAAAEDVTQETFLRLWRNRCVYESRGNLIGYLLRIAANLCRDRLRSAHPVEDLAAASSAMSDAPTPGEALEASALAEAVRRAVAALPEAQREVFVLGHYEQLSYREIAELLGCPVGTVASRRNLAVQSLRRRLRHFVEE